MSNYLSWSGGPMFWPTSINWACRRVKGPEVRIPFFDICGYCTSCLKNPYFFVGDDEKRGFLFEKCLDISLTELSKFGQGRVVNLFSSELWRLEMVRQKLDFWESKRNHKPIEDCVWIVSGLCVDLKTKENEKMGLHEPSFPCFPELSSPYKIPSIGLETNLI